MTIKQLFNQRRIKRTRTDLAQINLWLQQSKQDLKLAKKIAGTDPRWSLTIAYQAMLRCGRALMFSKGYLPRSGGAHKTVIDFTQIVLGKDLARLVRSFERLRRKRHDFFYGVLVGISKTEVKSAIGSAAKLIKEVRGQITKKRYQLRL